MSEQCAGEGCACSVEDDGVEHEGEVYCSESCARGEGCDHADCGCAPA